MILSTRSDRAPAKGKPGQRLTASTYQSISSRQAGREVGRPIKTSACVSKEIDLAGSIFRLTNLPFAKVLAVRMYVAMGRAVFQYRAAIDTTECVPGNCFPPKPPLRVKVYFIALCR